MSEDTVPSHYNKFDTESSVEPIQIIKTGNVNTGITKKEELMALAISIAINKAIASTDYKSGIFEVLKILRNFKLYYK